MFDSALVGILLPAFVAGLLVLTTHVPLGQEVLRRGIIFIDLAVAQIAVVGVVLALVMAWESAWAIQASAICTALIGAFILSLTEKRWPDEQEAIIGISFILASTAGILLLANNPHGGEYLKTLLAGQILWVNWEQLGLPISVYALTLVVLYALNVQSDYRWFFLLFAVNVTISVQLVGVYLVFATLIIPALATARLSGAYRLTAGYIIGVLGYAAGLTISTYFDLPSGPVVTWTLALVAVVYRSFSGYLGISRATNSNS